LAEERFLEIINARGVDSKLAARLISLYPLASPGSREMLLGLCEHERAAYRGAALGSFARFRGPMGMNSREALNYLDDSSLDVRRAAQRILYTNHDLSSGQLEALLDSKYSDVRLFILSSSRILPSGQGESLLGDLLLDESTVVRKQVLGEFSRRRLPQALEVLSLSLGDDSRELREAAAVGLYRLGTPEARRVLENFVRKTDDAELRSMIVTLLATPRPRPPVPRTRPPVVRPIPPR